MLVSPADRRDGHCGMAASGLIHRAMNGSTLKINRLNNGTELSGYSVSPSRQVCGLLDILHSGYRPDWMHYRISKGLYFQQRLLG